MSFAETFLEYPDLFPARNAGETAGCCEVWIDLVGGPYRFTGLNALQAERLNQWLVELGCAAGPAPEGVVTIHTFKTALRDFRRLEPKGWTQWIDFEYRPRSVAVAGRYFLGRLEWAPGLGGALWTPLEEIGNFREVVENYLRILVAYRLLALGGVLLHSAGVVHQDGVLLFVGRSGAGKTTVSRLAELEGKKVISDDINALLPTDDGWKAYRVPFFGDLGGSLHPSRTFKISGLFGLQKGKVNQVRAVSAAETTAYLLGCSPFINRDPHRQSALMDTVAEIAAQVAGFELTFRKNGGFWELLRAQQNKV